MNNSNNTMRSLAVAVVVFTLQDSAVAASPRETRSATDDFNERAAKLFHREYFKCQYVDNVLPTGMLKQGLHKTDGRVYEEFAGLLKALHQRLIERLEKEGRLTR